MAARPTVLMIGATGMLGRPVARRLAGEGFAVRVLARDLARAQKVLPAQCDVVRGDLRYQTSLQRALEGIDAVYVNLASPYSPRAWDAELEGTRRIVLAARRMNVNRILRLSAQGVPEAAAEWWAARRKADADKVVMDSGLSWTIFRPTWFTESLALFVNGRIMWRPGTPDTPLYWITGDDYARQVSRALTRSKTAGRVYVIQGPEPVPFAEAQRRFAAALGRRVLPVPMPRAILRAAGMIVAPTAYLSQLIDMTYRYTTDFVAEDAWRDLGEPTMTIEDYAAYLSKTGDFPRK